ncbi:MAG: ThiF family adenylyltransferase [Gemmataceae bacterium]|nr:ThiF family adenylyltransferase [Gemmataceae bacterium]
MSSTDADFADRDVRQRDLVPRERLARCHAVVVGVGAVGRQVALQLAATGVPAMTLYDPDAVGVENLAAQGFWEADVGAKKVDAVGKVCSGQLPRMELDARPERFRKSAVRAWPRGRDHAVFCCVDSVAARRLVWEAVRPAAAFFADGRMAAEVVRVLASDRPAVDAAYPATLFPPAEAFAGSCTAKATIYAASVAAGLLVGQFARWLRDLPVVPDQTLNLLAAELSAADPAV